MRKDFSECQQQMWDQSQSIEEEIIAAMNGYSDEIDALIEERERITRKREAAEIRLDDCYNKQAETENDAEYIRLGRAADMYDDLICKYMNKIDAIEDEISEYEDKTLLDYFNDCLDIEYIVSGDLDYLGCEICLAWGGPGIWINTRDGVIKGRWWGDKTDYYIDNIVSNAIDEIFEECYNSRRCY